MEVGNFHEAVSKTLSYGVCIHQGECQPDPTVSSFNLQQLENPLTWATMGWIKIINSHATFISILVILIKSGRFLIFIFLFLQTLLLHGLEAAQAIAYMVCCNAIRHSKTVSRRKIRPELPNH
jgi:hypothetical protein